ncbi:MAG: flippase-like domain-containing protein [Ardenticatenaceae bacterium]|nr:flippase-like domain-containing protein [Ardenticatenaceae bacterium]MCB9442792.1 flippase-like domain-containing protein [Ardenticatenaceae bacterium]
MKRRVLFWILIIAFIWVLIGRFNEIEKLAETLRGGRWQWVALAAVLQLGYYATTSLLYQVSFTAVGVHTRWRNLLPLTFAAVFVNSTAPSGGAAGVALYVDEAVRRGQSGAKTAVGSLLVLIADFGAFLVLLTIALGTLFTRHNLLSYEIITGSIMYLYVGGMTALLGLGLWRPKALLRVLQTVQNSVNRVGGWFRNPTLVRADWAAHNADEFAASAHTIAAQPRKLLPVLAAAFLTHAFDLASLFAIFRAFNLAAPLGVIIAGYSMTLLFWIVSPTPNGIGVVEGLMPLVYTSLGLPTAAATIITLAFRGLTFWIPFLVGFALLRRLPIFASPQRGLARLGQVRLIAILTGAMGLINVLSASTPALADRAALLEKYSPLAVTRGSNLTAVLAGFALIVLAYGLTQRKRTAWAVTLVVLLVSAVSHLLKGLDYEEATLAIFLAIYLLWQRAQFQARSDAPSLRQGVNALFSALAFTLVYGMTGFYLLDRHYSVNFSLDAALRQTVVMFTQFYDPGLQPITGFGRYFAASIYVVGGVTLVYALVVLLRPVILRQPATAAEWEQAKQIVEKYGRSTLARFVLFHDKSYWFSPGGSVVGYAARAKTAVALGDPIGPVEDGAAAITGFRDFCHRQGWQPAFYQTLPDYVELYRAAGFDVVRTGHEAIVDLHTFTLDGKAGKPFRTPINKLSRLNYRADIVQPPLSRELLRELREVSDEWLVMMHGKEMRFSLGWFNDDYIGSSTVIVIRDETGRATAFANVVPEYAQKEASIDLMRRRHEMENGTMEFLFGSLLLWCKEQGYDTFNLGLSSLSGVGEAPDDPAAEKAMHYVYDHINQFYNFQGLHNFKEKFNPIWEPRFVVFPGYASLPSIWLALARASSGDDFLRGYMRELPPMLRQMAKLVSERFNQQQAAHKENGNGSEAVASTRP